MARTLKGNEDIGAKKRDVETERAGRSPKSSPRIFSSRLHYPPRGHQVDASFIVIDGQRSDKPCYSFTAKYLWIAISIWPSVLLCYAQKQRSLAGLFQDDSLVSTVSLDISSCFYQLSLGGSCVCCGCSIFSWPKHVWFPHPEANNSPY